MEVPRGGSIVDGRAHAAPKRDHRPGRTSFQTFVAAIKYNSPAPSVPNELVCGNDTRHRLGEGARGARYGARYGARHGDGLRGRRAGLARETRRD